MKLRFAESLGAFEIKLPELVPCPSDWTGYQRYERSQGPTMFSIRIKGKPNLLPSPDIHDFVLAGERQSVTFRGILVDTQDVAWDADEDCPAHRFSRNLSLDTQLIGRMIPTEGGHCCIQTK